MEAAEATAKAAETKLDSELKKNAPLAAERDRTLSSGAKLAVDSAAVTKARASIAAREARAKIGAPAEVVAMLDLPAGGVPVEGNGPKPGAKPISQAEIDARKKKKSAEQEVEIVCDGGVTFDSKANLVVFEKNVVVNHPQFDLVCDKLIIFLKKNPVEGESGMEKAIATGKRVTVQQTDVKGDVQIGQARKVTFKGGSGDVILQDWPQAQDANKLVQAKEQGTIIILNQSGKMKVDGPSSTKILLPAKKPAGN